MDKGKRIYSRPVRILPLRIGDALDRNGETWLQLPGQLRSVPGLSGSSIPGALAYIRRIVMENAALLLIPALLAVVLIRLLMLPMKWIFKLALHSAAGFLCLWLLNTVAPFTGVTFPINGVTVLTAGFLGLPGIGILAVLAVF